MNRVCCGFGHKDLHCNLKDELNEAIIYSIEKYGVDLFYTGGMGEFDSAFASAVRGAKGKYPHIKLELVKPYFSNELNTNREYYEQFYNDVFIPADLADIHHKAVIGQRNRWMIDRSEFVIFAVHREFGGAWTAFNYARKQKKDYINLLEIKKHPFP